MAILTDEGIKEALNKRIIDKIYIKCPVCGGTGLNKNVFKITDDDGNGGCYPSCETCHGTGILEKIVVPDEEEVDGHMECISEEVNEAMNVKVDPTNPDHYKNSTSLECIEAMEIIFGVSAVIDFCVCNAWKYIWRWKNKNGAEDLDKAKWYIERARELIDYNDVVAAKNKYMDILLHMNDYIDDIERNWENED